MASPLLIILNFLPHVFWCRHCCVATMYMEKPWSTWPCRVECLLFWTRAAPPTADDAPACQQQVFWLTERLAAAGWYFVNGFERLRCGMVALYFILCYIQCDILRGRIVTRDDVGCWRCSQSRPAKRIRKTGRKATARWDASRSVNNISKAR